MATYPVVYAGQRLTSTLVSSWLPSSVRKPADTSRASTTVTTVDPDLQIADVPAGRYFEVDAVIVYAADAAADFRGGLQGPTGATFTGTYRAAAVGASSTNTPVVVDKQPLTVGFAFGGVGAATDMTALVKGTLYSGDGGVVSWHWAQWASSATATVVRSGSYIILRPIG